MNQRWTAAAAAALIALCANGAANAERNESDYQPDRTIWRDTPEWERYWGKLGKIFRGIRMNQIRYGNARNAPHLLGEIDPPFVTPERDSVEVLAFATYGHRSWMINEPVQTKWARTLPATVHLEYLPRKGILHSRPHPRMQPLWTVRQELYHTARELGTRPWDAHRYIIREVVSDNWGLEHPRSQKRYAKRLKLEPETFQAVRATPAVRWRSQVADWLELAHDHESVKLEKRVARRTGFKELLFPELLINGRWLISMSGVVNPIECYQIANWAIEHELGELESNRHWPRDVEELVAWLEEREGQILARQINGEWTDQFPRAIVYDNAAKALWMIEKTGTVQNVATLTHDEHGLHFVYTDDDGQQQYFDPWPLTRQYTTFTRTDGAKQRHARELLDNALRRHEDAIALRFEGEPWNITFKADGTLLAQTETGTVTMGGWALEKQLLEVTLEDGTELVWYPFYVAKQAGFELPEESYRPWDFTDLFASTQTTPTPLAPKTASALRLEEILNRIREQTEMYRQRNKAAEARQEAREAAERLQSSHEQR